MNNKNTHFSTKKEKPIVSIHTMLVGVSLVALAQVRAMGVNASVGVLAGTLVGVRARALVNIFVTVPATVAFRTLACVDGR
jgi:hypothetical protein